MVKSNLPVILFKGLVLLPLKDARIELNNDISKKVIDLARETYNDLVLIVAPKNELEEMPDTSDLPRVGVVAKITNRIDLPNNHTRLVLSGLYRVRVLNYKTSEIDKDVLESTVITFPEETINEIEETALLRKLNEELEKYISANPYISNSIINQIKNTEDLDTLTDKIANFMPLNLEKRTILMQESSKINRAKKLIKELNIELSVLELEKKIDENLNENLDKIQKEMILKERIKVIKEELNEKNSKDDFINYVNEKLNNNIYPENIKERINRELSRYDITSESNPEISNIRNYIETLLDIPFNIYTKENTDLKKVEDCLNKTHYALNEVKERIIEYIAVSLEKSNAPIICLIGPPGVGKTTLASSIASALNKNFAKISLGGMNDPAELTGHRKTYIGSEPGKIVTSLIKTKSMNPVILLDEVDKISKDYKGDPVNVLLDLLDTSNVKSFTDNFIEEKLDLSKVTFILTANDKSGIPLVLQDRLEIIEINSYLDFEKLSIAKDYLIKNALEEYSNGNIIFTDEAINLLINGYTKEAGVRELSRLIKRIVRKVITESKLNGELLLSKTIDKNEIIKYLGIEKYKNYKTSNKVGFARGLAYTMLGGDVLEIEVTSYKGKEEFVSTGSLGEVLKESIGVSIGYIKSNMNKFHLDKEAFNKTIHINFREGGMPKDGPSAGTIITTALLSYLLKKEIPSNISMTGEITLLGDVLGVGGLREKTSAAIKNGITKIYVSSKNKREIYLLPKEIKDKIDFIFVNNYSEIYKDIFTK